MSARVCSIEGCHAPHEARGWCQQHYDVWKKRGDPLAPPRPATGRPVVNLGKTCSVEGCDEPARTRGWCPRHYLGWRNYGDPELARPMGKPKGVWFADFAGYSSAHHRVKSFKGLARDQSCVDCGGPARDWSYRRDASQRIESSEGAYSLNPEDYEPRCRACHRVYDNS